MKNTTSKPEKIEGDLKNALKAVRTRLKMSQGELAARAGVARQTIGGIEAALYAPSAAVALRLSRALGCRVEELFWLEAEAMPTISATRAASDAASDAGAPAPNAAQERLLIGQVGQHWVAHSLRGDAAFRAEMLPADGLALPDRAQTQPQTGAKRGRKSRSEQEAATVETVEVQLLDAPESLARTVLIAGCSPAISLWTRSATRFHPGLRPSWIHANSSRALQMLGRGEIHLAGLHLCDPRSGAENEPFVRAALGETAAVLVNFGVWEEGLLLPRGNPRRVRGVEDLAENAIQFIGREAGSGSRLLLETLLQEANIPFESLDLCAQTAWSHREVAQFVREQKADAGMGTAAMAQLYDLDFVPLRAVRFDFAARADCWQQEPVSQLFETLSHRAVRLQLQKLGGYNTERTGDVVARW